MDLSAKIEKVNKILEAKLPNDVEYGKITEAMRYSIMNGGKRLRAIMLLETAALYTNDEYILEELVEPFAAAIEFIHGYSLVHDDLPAMDNDVLRRGLPTTHVKYGHAMGVLAGDALLNYAYETVADIYTKLIGISDEKLRLELYERVGNANHIIARKPGYSGMIGGQVLDTAVEYPYSVSVNNNSDNTGSSDINTSASTQNSDSRDEINKAIGYGKKIYELKTSQLIEIALMCGAVLGGAEEKDISLLEQAGYSLGLAFQIQDDILDMISSAEVLGKSVQKDAENGKPTIARLVGIEKAEEMVREYTDKSIACLKALNRNTGFLEELFLSLINRNK